MNRSNKILVIGFFIILLVSITGVAYIQLNQEKQEEYKLPSPEQVVRQYFESWNRKNYPDMYATLSDGFKKIEATAKNLSAFKTYASSQNIQNITIFSIKETSNDGTTASVDYSIQFVLNDNTKHGFNGTFTLKLRTGDVIFGWKLIHPYGDKIDNS